MARLARPLRARGLVVPAAIVKGRHTSPARLQAFVEDLDVEDGDVEYSVSQGGRVVHTAGTCLLWMRSAGARCKQPPFLPSPRSKAC